MPSVPASTPALPPAQQGVTAGNAAIALKLALRRVQPWNAQSFRGPGSNGSARGWCDLRLCRPDLLLATISSQGQRTHSYPAFSDSADRNTRRFIGKVRYYFQLAPGICLICPYRIEVYPVYKSVSQVKKKKKAKKQTGKKKNLMCGKSDQCQKFHASAIPPSSLCLARDIQIVTATQKSKKRK